MERVSIKCFFFRASVAVQYHHHHWGGDIVRIRTGYLELVKSYERKQFLKS